jgi:ferric-dicitrate binding protein FerR (iron transport regulator)
MNSKEKRPKKLFEEALSQVKAESLNGDDVRGAAEKAWATVQAEANTSAATPVARISGCEDFQALMPDYLAHQLAPARRTLLEDHLRECVECRKSFWTQKAPEAAKPLRTRHASPVWKWAAAACLLVAFGVGQYLVLDKYVFSDRSLQAVAQQINGRLLVVEGATLKPVSIGQIVELDQLVKTGRGSDAVLRLNDGSLVEMRERSELSLDATSKGPMIRLRRGSVIVQAAKQKEGHRLAVDTDDCRVTVKGTVFAVTRATRGARVSVVEGEVWVQQGGETKTLRPGQQISTSATLQAVPIEEEVSWSRNADQHLALLRELVTLGQDLATRMASDELRYNSNLLPLIPENTVFYAAFPNVSQSFGEAYDSFRGRIQADPALQGWWQQMNEPGEAGLTPEEVIDRVRQLGAHLGREIVVAVAQPQTGDHKLLLLAEVNDAAALRAALAEDLTVINSAAGRQAAVLVDNPSALTADPASESLLFYLGPGFLAVSPNVEEIQRVSVAGVSGATPPSSAFRQRLAQTYDEGAGWLFAADMERLIGSATEKSGDAERSMQEKLGLSDFQQLVIEQKSVNGQLQSRAVLGFNQPRRGLTSWLGESGPMGALEFVSPDAFAVGCFLIKDPALIIDEIFDITQSAEGQNGLQEVVDYLAAQGLNIREDIAAPLGSEVLFAVDGPLLPSPAWKVVVEVDDQARLQRTMERLVLLANQEAEQRGKPGVTLIPATLGGMSYYRVVTQSGPEVTYMYWNGYMVVTPSAALLSQAVQYASSGYTLGQAPAFRALFPAEGSDYCAGLLYQNFTPVLGSLASYVPENSALTPDQLKTLKETITKTPPTLIAVYGGPDNIVFSSRGLPGLNMLAMAAVGDLWHMANATPQALIK